MCLEKPGKPGKTAAQKKWVASSVTSSGGLVIGIGFYNEPWGNMKKYCSSLPGRKGKVKDFNRYEFSGGTS